MENQELIDCKSGTLAIKRGNVGIFFGTTFSDYLLALMHVQQNYWPSLENHFHIPQSIFVDDMYMDEAKSLWCCVIFIQLICYNRILSELKMFL